MRALLRLLALLPLTAWAQALVSEAIPVQHRGDATELGEPGRALAEADRAPRRLLISVRQERRADARGSGTGARSYHSRSARDEGQTQRLQVLEGHAAWVRTGEWVPVPEAAVLLGPRGAGVVPGLRHLERTDGFYVVPRVAGERVTVGIGLRRADAAPGDGGVSEVQEMETVLSGRLGEWLAVGEGTEQAVPAGSATVYSTRAAANERRVVLIKVEDAP
jgi:hypothetical protein